MDVELTDDTAWFVQQASALMATDPFSTNVIAVHVSGVVAGWRPQSTADRWMTVSDGGAVVGIAMHTPPFPLFISRMPESAAGALARHLGGLSYRFVGVNGEAAAATAFAEVWEQGSGQQLPVAVATRFYRLGELRPPTGVPGSARTATAADGPLMRRWAHAFRDEAMPEEPADDLDASADRRVALGQFTLWIDEDTVVSMAGHTEPAQGVARIGPVYTPPRFRGRGYGAAVTARASQVALQAGAEEVVLYTDQSNPVSNAVYQRIGYVADHDAHERKVRD